MSLVEIDCLRVRDRDRIRRSHRQFGLPYRVRTRSRFCGIRETAALVNYFDRYSGRSRGRTILSWLRNRTLADDWSRALLVGHNSTGYFFHWPLVGRRG